MWKVQIWEYERGWGPRLDEVKEFTEQEEALFFQQSFNAQNDLPEVPDWYMTAETPYYEEK